MLIVFQYSFVQHLFWSNTGTNVELIIYAANTCVMYKL